MPKVKKKKKLPPPAPWSVYILKCADGTLYTGITNNIPRRLELHESAAGAKYTRGRGPFKVVYTEELTDRSAASKRERQIKALARKEKMALAGL